MSPLEVVARFVPTLSWLRHIVPERFQHSLQKAAEELNQGTPPSTSSYVITSTSSSEGSDECTLSFASGGGGAAVVHCCAGGEAASAVDYSSPSESLRRLLPFQQQLLSNLLMDHSIGQHVCVLGPKVCAWKPFHAACSDTRIWCRAVESQSLPGNSHVP